MISSYCLVGIEYVIFCAMSIVLHRKHMGRCSKGELALFYLVSRILPVLIMQDTPGGVWRNLILDAVVLCVLAAIVIKRNGKERIEVVLSWYLFQPVLALAILSGSLKRELVLAVAVLVGFYVLDAAMKRKQALTMYAYLLATAGAFCVLYAMDILGQTVQQLEDKAKLPVLLAIGGLGIFLGGAIFLVSLARTKTQRTSKKSAEETCVCAWPKQEVPESRVTGKDLLIMGILTVLFGVAVFFRLGSQEAPETSMNFETSGEEYGEIVLQFDEPVTVSAVYVNLGYAGLRNVSLSYVKPNQAQWTVLDGDYTLKSAFAWNQIQVGQELQYFGIVLRESNMQIFEIICIDDKGNKLLPSNAQDYKELFDEQELYPEKNSYYYQTMFDEVYHARTAYEFVHKLPIYETSHPPLGKTLISLGIRIWGMNPFGYRVVCAFLGTALIPVMYLLALWVGRKREIAIFSTVLICTAFMNYTLSRIATLDILVAFFVMLLFVFTYRVICMLRERRSFKEISIWILLTGITMGFTIAVKWTGVYACIGVVILFFYYMGGAIRDVQDIKQNAGYYWKLFAVCMLCFVVIPLAIYTISFWPFLSQQTGKNLIQIAFENSKGMLTYHANTVFDHPYSSEWYEWLIDKQPLLDSYSRSDSEHVSIVATFCNPLICFVGLIALVYHVYLWKSKKDWNAPFILIMYASVLIPWLFVHRTVFIYQYCLGYLCLPVMIGNMCSRQKKGKWWMIGIAAVSVILFGMFFPVMSGMSVKQTYVQTCLRWAESWPFR